MIAVIQFGGSLRKRMLKRAEMMFELLGSFQYDRRQVVLYLYEWTNMFSLPTSQIQQFFLHVKCAKVELLNNMQYWV